MQDLVEDHLNDLLIKHFDPKKADTIFTEGGEVLLHERLAFYVNVREGLGASPASYTVCGVQPEILAIAFKSQRCCGKFSGSVREEPALLLQCSAFGVSLETCDSVSSGITKPFRWLLVQCNILDLSDLRMIASGYILLQQ